MTNLIALAFLALAALLEAAGDAIVRGGLRAQGLPHRLGLVAAGGVVLTLYAVILNTRTWDFGRLLGVYVSLFFIAAQVINWIAFKAGPSLPVLVGGALIVGGGLLMTFWGAGPA